MFRRFSRWTDTIHTPEDEARLGACLAFVAGAANAGGFLAIGRYTSHMTGMVSEIADHLVLGNYYLVAAAAAAVLAFVAGAMTTAILVNLAARQRLRARYSIPLLVESALLLLFGLISPQLSHHPTPLLVPLTIVLLGFLMGLQNAVITKISLARIRTTHVTGLVTDIGIELGKLVYINRNSRALSRRQAARVVADRRKLKVHGLLLTCFLGGALAGAMGFKAVGYAMTLPLALLLLLLAAPPLWNDLRIRSRFRATQRLRSQRRQD